MKFTTLFRSSYAITFFVGMAAPAMAAPITYFSSSITQVSAESQNCGSLACAQAPSVYENEFNSSGGVVNTSRSYAFAEGQSEASSSANLTTGDLKAVASVNSTTNFS